MTQQSIADAWWARGAKPGVVAAHLRELTGLRAFITLPGIGDTDQFDYSKGGKQVGMETPDEWNALIEHMLEPLVASWRHRGFSFKVDLGGNQFEYINHAVWCDNVILFATNQIMLQTILADISGCITKFDLIGSRPPLKSCLLDALLGISITCLVSVSVGGGDLTILFKKSSYFVKNQQI